MKKEFGDFQTPAELAAAVCARVRRERFASIVEPNCGRGVFLFEALRGVAAGGYGFDIQSEYVASARALLRGRAVVERADFFEKNWASFFSEIPGPILIVGNPPWVTNSALSGMGSRNLPAKRNSFGLKGLDAITGRSNFDISEWMLIRLLEAAADRDVTIAMLVKTAVARKVLAHAWKNGFSLNGAEIRSIDAMKYFGASVDACLFVFSAASRGSAMSCEVFDSIDAETPSAKIGWREERIVADVETFDQFATFFRASATPWRSGIKHDCAPVMELRREGARCFNRLGDRVSIETRSLYPLLKASDLARGRPPSLERLLLVTQHTPGEDTTAIARAAPKTWRYLQRHRERLDHRASKIYQRRPRFSIFGVGPYTFSPWKIAISGLHKSLDFRVIGPVEGRPVVFDDTCYFLPFESERAARAAARMLSSARVQAMLRALIFWDNKRPITADVLNRIDLTVSQDLR